MKDTKTHYVGSTYLRGNFYPVEMEIWYDPLIKCWYGKRLDTDETTQPFESNQALHEAVQAKEIDWHE